MAKLEYRLYDEEKGFPALYHYDSISKDEILCRCLSDYWVKDGIVYERTSNSLEIDIYIIYVKPANDELPMLLKYNNSEFIEIEIREYHEDLEEYPLIKTLEMNNLTDVALFGLCNYFLLEGKEWEQTSFEIDEDRKTYVIYAKLASNS